MGGVAMTWYEPTMESVREHWEAMGDKTDDGLCITLCMRRRSTSKVFCEECRAAWGGVLNAHQWIINQRVINTSLALWPSWM